MGRSPTDGAAPVQAPQLLSGVGPSALFVLLPPRYRPLNRSPTALLFARDIRSGTRPDHEKEEIEWDGLSRTNRTEP